MIKEIKYTGYSANPSDYECSEGELATAVGLVQEDGALKPILPPATVLNLADGEVVKFVHEVSNTSHFIILNSHGNLKWRFANSSATFQLRTFSSGIYQISAIGNTLIVLASDGMHYFLWKGNSDGYLYLGTEIPECPLSFGLQGEVVKTEWFDITYAKDSDTGEVTEDTRSLLTDQVFARVNAFVADNATNNGRFIFPFFVRYAYRLFDGSLTKHSAPVLMVASTGLNPQVICFNANDTHADAEVLGIAHSLDYAVSDNVLRVDLLNWSDIIKSIDVFISAPIYTYDSDGLCSKFLTLTDHLDRMDYCVSKHINPLDGVEGVYTSHFMTNLRLDAFGGDQWTPRLLLPEKSNNTINENIKNCSQFYFLKSIKIEQLSTERTIIDIGSEYLQSLVTREVMSDDYDSHEKLIPRYSFPYNSRLNITNISKEVFKGYHPASTFCHTSSSAGVGSNNTISVYVFIKLNGDNLVVKRECGGFAGNNPIVYFYYPNNNAYKAVYGIPNLDGGLSYYEMQLEPHGFLNGAFYLADVGSLPAHSSASKPYESINNMLRYDIPNKIYTSEINNPFYFPLLGINTVGTGDIIGISSAAKALSQGQFGQFPLYAFTSEGVWALEVSSTGSYIARQPITRDVCINADSITQIDSAVLFATDRGIMLISGSQAQCISDILLSEDLFTVADLPKSTQLLSIYNSNASSSEQMSVADITFVPFIEYITECLMAYDYVHQRIIVFNPNESYAYVYSMKSKAWGMMQSNFSSSVNSYPEALAMTSDHKLVDFSTSNSNSATGLAITRPFSLSDPNMFKSINTIIQRGNFDKDNIKQVLYGSNDLYNWGLVWSSADKYMRGFSGTPYKAYRLALICDFGKAESLSGCSVQFIPRMGNQPR